MASVSTFDIPYIDPNVEHVGVSRLRQLNSKRLRGFDTTLVIQDNNTPLAVLLSYERFLMIQRQLQSVLNTIEVLTNEHEYSALKAGLHSARAGRTRPLSEIRAARRKRRS
jgi:PHD/YefM family antitoxin component YafN of YafNO toxin-antitoxin module